MNEENATADEREIHTATKDVIDRLADFDNETRRRVFRRAMGFFELDMLPSVATSVAVQADLPKFSAHPSRGKTDGQHFADRSELPPKEFLFQKQPRTDIERIACLAYYLTHYRDTRHFKTIDISKLNTEAAQIKFSNTAFAVVNAANAGLLASAGRGNKQLSALGERYVDALPDRDAAKEILASVQFRRRRKATKNKPDSRLPRS
jgi:restriction endonuclease Mrr